MPTYEIKEAYIGKKKRLFTRVIIYRLTEEQILGVFSHPPKRRGE